MRVMMVSWDFPPRTTGGTGAHVAGLSEGLSRAGHEVVVITIAAKPAEFEAKQPDSTRVIRTLVDLPWLPPSDKIARTASANHAATKVASRLTGDLAGWTPDIVHGHDWRLGWAADSVASRYNVPFVLTMHGTERVRHGGQLPAGAPTDISSIEWWLAFQADKMIAPTRFIVEHLVTGFELSPDHVVHIPKGIDPDLWRPTKPSGDSIDAVANGGVPLVLAWGQIKYEKGFQVLARAIYELRSRVPHVRSVIAGRGTYLPELQTQIDVEGVADIIDLPGFLGDSELRRLVHEASCVVIPSLYEPFGIVALEALAAGAPLIVADTGGLAELIEGTKAGITFEPGNPDDLADAIESILTDDQLAQSLRLNARELVEQKYAWDAIATAHAAVYTGVERGAAGNR